MHIAYLTTEYPHPTLPPAGGIGSFVKTMADSLTKTGSQVTVFVCFSEEDREWKDGKINIVQIKKISNLKLSVILDRVYINKVINQYIDRYKIQIAEAPDWEGIHAFCNFKIPLITRIHGSVSYFNKLENRSTPRIIRFLEKKALKKTKSVIAVSNYSGELTGELFGFKKFKFTTIYNGIDSNKFQNLDDVFEANSILYFGTLVRKKGVLEIPYIFEEVLKQNSNAKLFLVGKDAIDPIERISTWQLIHNSLSEQAKESVTYLGTVPYSEIINIINNSQLCIFPSFAEAFPISWLEAIAMSKPLVTSNFGWANESIENNTSGFLVDPKSHKAFADKINFILSNKEIADQMGKQARKRATNLFDQSIILPINMKFYKETLDNKKVN